MKFIFKKDTGKLYGTSPDFILSEEQIEELYCFAANQWDDVPEVECFDTELVLWFSEKPKTFKNISMR